jgi:DNA-3-methyladenine glycosylase II
MDPRIALGARTLADWDPVIAGLLARYGIPDPPVPEEDPFSGLVRGIVSQQIAGVAAEAIRRRLVLEAGGSLTPETILPLSETRLRAVGLSRAKAASIHDLARKVADGSVVTTPSALEPVSDEEVIAGLSTVRGIGPWSAQMFLIFQLHRLDVWPIGDLAVRNGFGSAWGIVPPTPRILEALGAPFKPYRTIVAWYCWMVARDNPSRRRTTPRLPAPNGATPSPKA